jgi:hypothetical protein
MGISRRKLCATGAFVLSSQITLDTVSAQNSIQVDATVRSEIETDVSGVEFFIQNISTNELSTAIVGRDETISLSIPEFGSYRVGITDIRSGSNKIPVVYSFDDIEIEQEGNIGEFVIPEAHKTDIRFVDGNDNPIENLPVNFRAENGRGLPPDTFTTNSEGYVKYPSSTETGVELASPTEVEIQPSGSDYDKIQTISVSGPTEFEFAISNPERYKGGGLGGSPTGGSNSGRQRGLFSNSRGDGTQSGPLSNPTNLTTLGFLLSVAGIVYQLIGGR